MSRKKIETPNQIDIHVGRRIRLRRTILGMNQSDLANAIGLTFQQVQKYERGSNRIGSSKLYLIAQALDVPVSYFFEEMDKKTATNTAPADSDLLQKDPAAKRETMELVRAFAKIEDPAVRDNLYQSIVAISDGKG